MRVPAWSEETEEDVMDTQLETSLFELHLPLLAMGMFAILVGLILSFALPWG